MKKQKTSSKWVGIGLMALALGLTEVSCTDPKGEPQEYATDLLSWEENKTTEGCKLYADYPKGGNENLMQNVREWINEQLGAEYNGNLNDGNNMLKYYGEKQAATIQREIEELGENTAMSKSVYYMELKRNFESEKFVTYTSNLYTYMGGAHGMEAQEGATFRKADGRKFGWDMFKNNSQSELSSLIKNGLKKQYFEVSDDEEFYPMLLVEEQARYSFPLPASAPYFTREGVKFTYQQYEIAPYAAGIPSCIIPYDSLANLFTVTVMPLVESTTDSIASKEPVLRYNPPVQPE